MIKFRTKLTEDTSNPVASALVLFSIHEGINIYDLSREDINNALNELSVRGILKNNEDGILEVTQPIYNIQRIKQDPEIPALREIFSYAISGQYGLMGKKDEVEDALNKFFIRNPTVSFEEVLKAGRAYVQNCRMKNSFISKLPNFISGDLEVWVEEKAGIRNEESLLDRGR